MKKSLYFLVLLILFNNTSYSSDITEQLWREKTTQYERNIIYVGIAAFCWLAYRNKSSLVKCLKWLLSYPSAKKSQRSSWGSDESSDEEFDFSDRAEDCGDIEKKIEKSSQQKYDCVTKLHKACHKNDAKEVISLLPGVDTQTLNARYHYWRNFEYRPFSISREKTALIMACEKQNIAIVDALLSRNDIDLNIQDHYKRTALMIACEKGNHIIVQKLLENKNIDINSADKFGRKALDIAYAKMFKNKSRQDTHIFSLLLQRDEVDPTGVLALACLYNDMDMFNELLNHKNTQKFLKNNHALYAACKNGNVEMVEQLLKLNSNNCMDINKWVCNFEFYSYRKMYDVSNEFFYNPLHIACKRGAISHNQDYIKIVKLLLTHDFIDINQKTARGCLSGTIAPSKDGFTVFHLAATHSQLLELLLKKDSTAINESVYKYRHESKRWRWLYTEKKRHDYSTPLHVALKAGNLTSIMLLLRYGADITINGGRDTIFELACEKVGENSSYHEIVKQLIEYLKANPNTQEKVSCARALGLAISPMCVAHVPTIELLLSYTTPNEKIPHRLSSISKYKHYFSLPIIKSARRNLAILNMFIDDYEGNCGAYNHRGNTVLFTAFMAGIINHPNQINFLRDLGATQKKEFMCEELIFISHSDPIRKAKIINKWNGMKTKEEREKNIYRLHLFVKTCVEYGKISPEEITTLFSGAYKTMQSVTHNDKCQYEHEQCCCKYKEVVVHALMHHAGEQQDKQQKIDQKIAVEYKDTFMQYYSKIPEEKESVRKYFAKNIA